MKNTFEVPGYTIKRLDGDNIFHLNSLYEACYRQKRAEDFYPRKYETGFTGKKWIGYLAYDQRGEVAAFYGVIPCFIQYQDDSILAAQSSDTMTHPDHRGKGLFLSLARNCYGLCRNEGIKVLFGFPNQDFYAAASGRLEWKTTDQMVVFTIHIKWSPFKKLVIKTGLSRKSEEEVLADCYSGEKGLANSVLAEGYAGILREENYFNYKSFNKTHVIILGGMKCWVKINKDLIIGDMDISSEDSFPLVMEMITDLGSELGCERIHFHSSPGTRLHDLFAKQYSPAPSFPVILMDFGSGIPNDKFKFTSADADTF